MNLQWEDVPGVELRKQICTFTAEDPDKAYRFVNDVNQAKSKILRDPETPREIESGYRKMRPESFPFTLVYTIVEKPFGSSPLCITAVTRITGSVSAKSL